MIDGDRCIEVQFTPNNAQDFGFSGELYVLADSTYRVKRVKMGVPMNTGINFVQSMKIDQTYEELPSGEQVLTKDNMLVLLKAAKRFARVPSEAKHNLFGLCFRLHPGHCI